MVLHQFHRSRWEEIHHLVCKGRTSIPCRLYRKIPPSRKIWNSYWRSSTSLPRCRSRVPLYWTSLTCRKCCSWQQEESYCTQTYYPCGKEWWGAEQTSSCWRRTNHCFWRISPQHSRCPLAKKSKQIYNQTDTKNTNPDFITSSLVHKDEINWIIATLV